MAALDRNLFSELKLHYPTVPDHIVESCMSQLGNDRERCLETLHRESTKYSYTNNNNCQVNDQISRLNDVTIGEPRPRSDSSGSNMSNTSSGSASSRPLYHSHSLINVPGHRGPIISSNEVPNSAPVIVDGQLNQFIPYGNPQNPQTIPNIDCVTRRQSEGQMISSYQTHQQQQVLRQIEVQHINTNNDPKDQNVATYHIHVDPNGRGSPAIGGNHRMTHNNPSQSMTPNRGELSYRQQAKQPYHNVTFPNNPVTTAFPVADSRNQHQYNLNLPQNHSQFVSPTEENRGFSIGGVPYNQQYGAQLSQATIFLNPAASPNSHYNVNRRTDRTLQQSPIPGQYRTQQSSSDSDMSPGFVRSPVGSQPTTPSVTGPIVVEIKTNTGKDPGVQSQINYFNKMAVGSNSGPSGGGQQTLGQGSVIGQSHNLDNYVPDNHGGQLGPSQLSYNRLYTSERPTVINIEGASTSHQQEGGDFLMFPPTAMPNVCVVPGHPQGTHHTPTHQAPGGGGHNNSASGSVDSETLLDYRPVPAPRPYVSSPASSHSSLSSESSAAIRDRPRSGSLDDPAYLQALLSHQNSRMEKLLEDLNMAGQRVTQLKGEVTELERNVIERKRKRKSTFPSSVDLAKLRGDNLQLQADIQMMTREIDLFNNGQTPLGVLDPIEQQNFYKNMNTGQRGSIYGNAAQAQAAAQMPPPSTQAQPMPITFTSTATTTAVTTLTTPTRPPPEIPPLLPPRDNPGREVPPPIPPRVVPSQVPPPPPQQPAVSSGESDTDGEQWSCSACTFLNHPALNKCECCEMPRMTVTPAAPASPGDVPDTYPTPVQTAQST